jgi:hypothetical protein
MIRAYNGRSERVAFPNCQWRDALVSKRIGERSEGAPSRTMAGSYDGKVESPHRIDSVRDYALVCSNKMQTADNSVQRNIGETGFCVREDVDTAFAHDVYRHKALRSR